MGDTKIEMKLEEETKKLSEICEKLVDAAKHQLDGGIENVDTEEFGKVIDAIKDLCDAKEKVVKKCYYATILKAMEKSEEEDKEEEKYLMRMLKEEHKDEFNRMREEYGEDEGERRFYDNYRYKSSGRFAPTGRGSYMPRGSGRRGRRGYEEMIMPVDYRMPPEIYDPEYYRDMDRMSGKMYYSGGGNSGGSYGGNSGGSSYSGNSGGNSGGNSSGGNMRGYEEYQRGYSEGRSDGYNQGRSDGRNSQSRDYREGRSGASRRGYMESRENHKENTPESKQANMRELEKYMKSLSEDLTEAIEGASNEEKTMLKSKLQTLVQKIQ